VEKKKENWTAACAVEVKRLTTRKRARKQKSERDCGQERKKKGRKVANRTAMTKQGWGRQRHNTHERKQAQEQKRFGVLTEVLGGLHPPQPSSEKTV